MKKHDIPIDEIKTLLSYDPSTGDLFWKPRPRIMFKNQRGFSTWNARYANKPIGVDSRNGRKILHLAYNGRIRMMATSAIWAIHYGVWPSGVIDHINGDCSDDRISNLRDTTTARNNRNTKKRRNNTSGVVGVHYNTRVAKWVASINVDKRHISLGYFDLIEDAARARRNAEDRYGFCEALKYEDER